MCGEVIKGKVERRGGKGVWSAWDGRKIRRDYGLKEKAVGK